MSSRTIVITGASRGLGRAMVDELIRAGHRVHGCARSPRAIEELNREHGAPHTFDVVDIARDDEVAAWAERCLAEYTPDLLINNAALINANAPAWEVPSEEFDSVVDVNLKGTANLVRRFVPAMVAANRGVIVNFSSGWGRSVSPEVAPYCLTKWGIEGYTQALALELPRGMAAIPLNPGIIDTDMLRSCFGGSASAYPDANEWAADAVPFLLRLGPEHNGRSLTVGDRV